MCAIRGATYDHLEAPARTFLKVANRQGGFDNLSDTRSGLEAVLSSSFSEVDVAGSLALFTARKPIHP